LHGRTVETERGGTSAKEKARKREQYRKIKQITRKRGARERAVGTTGCVCIRSQERARKTVRDVSPQNTMCTVSAFV